MEDVGKFGGCLVGVGFSVVGGVWKKGAGTIVFGGGGNCGRGWVGAGVCGVGVRGVVGLWGVGVCFGVLVEGLMGSSGRGVRMGGEVGRVGVKGFRSGVVGVVWEFGNVLLNVGCRGGLWGERGFWLWWWFGYGGWGKGSFGGSDVSVGVGVFLGGCCSGCVAVWLRWLVGWGCGEGRCGLGERMFRGGLRGLWRWAEGGGGLVISGGVWGEGRRGLGGGRVG